MSYIYISRLAFFFLLCIPTFSQAKLSKKQNDPLIVLFHGLANTASSFNTMKQGLEHAFPAASVVALTSVEGEKSVVLSIEEQNALRFQELGQLDNRPIILIGHSQGGVAACNFAKQNEHILNIKGVVTLAAPWEGVPGARVDSNMLLQHLTDPVLKELSTLSIGLNYPEDELKKRIVSNVAFNQSVCAYPGSKDLMAGSAVLLGVSEWLSKTKIPILAIGGGGSNFGALLPKTKKRSCFKALNALYTFFVVGEAYPNNSPHDMQLPLYSQHALNIVPKSNKNFKRVFIKDAFHSTHVLSVPVPVPKAILAHPKALRSVIKFAKKRLK